jgi:hypothetical protein
MELKHLDFYCERTSEDFWAEPLNAWTNVGFILAGLWSLWMWLKFRKQNPLQTQTRPLIMACLLVLVGIGSFAFHTFADNVTYFGDLIPIFIFTSTYLYHSSRRYLQYSVKLSSLILAACIFSMALIEMKVPKSILNGSLLYAPPLLLLFFFASQLRKLRDPVWSKFYFAAAFVFLAALTFRTLDMQVCENFPAGTHFVWHTLNSICLGILLWISIGFDRDNPRILPK